MMCLVILEPGRDFEHWCDLPAGHAGDHRCGDCGDVWNPCPDGDENEPHERFEGSCPLCRIEQEEPVTVKPFSSQAGLASLRAGAGIVTGPRADDAGS